MNKISNSLTDLDSDGCQDSTEDNDDDSDTFIDSDDDCPLLHGQDRFQLPVSF